MVNITHNLNQTGYFVTEESKHVDPMAKVSAYWLSRPGDAADWDGFNRGVQQNRSCPMSAFLRALSIRNVFLGFVRLPVVCEKCLSVHRVSFAPGRSSLADAQVPISSTVVHLPFVHAKAYLLAPGCVCATPPIGTAKEHFGPVQIHTVPLDSTGSTAYQVHFAFDSSTQ